MLGVEVIFVTKVSCKVSSCHYWGSGDECKASEIMVKNNFGGGIGRGTDMEVGQIGQGDEAGTSPETMCETFIPTKSDKAMTASSQKTGQDSGIKR